MRDSSDRASADAAALMRFQAQKRSAIVAYALWCLIFFGLAGIHRFYAGRVFSGLILLLLGLVCVALAFLSFGLLTFLWVIPGLWALIDLLLIPGMVRDYNENLIRRLT